MGEEFGRARAGVRGSARRSTRYGIGLVGAYVVGAAVLCTQLAFILPGTVVANSSLSAVPEAAQLTSRGAISPERETPIPEIIALAESAPSVVAPDAAPAPELDSASPALIDAPSLSVTSLDFIVASDEPTSLEPVYQVVAVTTDREFLAQADVDLPIVIVSPTPVPASTPMSSPERRTSLVSYIVAPGDTQSAIAARFGVSQRTILLANQLKDGADLEVGRKLVVLPVSGFLHVVADGENVLTIADKYMVMPEEIAVLNSLADPDVIVKGQELILPEAPDANRQPVTSAEIAVPVATANPTATQARPTATLVPIVPTATATVVPTATATVLPTSTPPKVVALSATSVVVNNGGVYVVVAGDTAYSISRRFGVTAAALLQANGLDSNATISPGQKLTIPGSMPAPAAVSPTVRATATALPTAPPSTATPVPTVAPTARPAATQVPAVSAPAAPRGAAIVATAQRFVGYRYVWGGSSPQPGFDCSGLVYYVLRQNGLNAPRDLAGQYAFGPRIDRSALKPGDVVFFQNTYKPGLSHDGIYIGNGQFIHAATENVGVTISRLDHPYWGARFLGAIRP